MNKPQAKNITPDNDQSFRVTSGPGTGRAYTLRAYASNATRVYIIADGEAWPLTFEDAQTMIDRSELLAA